MTYRPKSIESVSQNASDECVRRRVHPSALTTPDSTDPYLLVPLAGPQRLTQRYTSRQYVNALCPNRDDDRQEAYRRNLVCPTTPLVIVLFLAPPWF